MAAKKLLPDDHVLVALKRQGWTYDEIAQKYGVTRGAVYLRLREAGAVQPQGNNRHLIPWVVLEKHTHAVPVEMLRLLARKERGDEIPVRKARMLDKWLERVKEADVVISYEPDYPPNPASPEVGGFYYSRRRDADGTNLVRVEEGVAVRPGPG